MKFSKVVAHGAASSHELKKVNHTVHIRLVGMRNGFRGSAYMTVDEALRLRRRLAHAVDQLIGRFEREMREAQEQKDE